MDKIFNFKEAKSRINLTRYLESLGHRPAQSGNDLWYYSPFHEEKYPSFKVDNKFQIWYDHSLGIGGDLIDFGMRFHSCNHSELLQKFKDFLSYQEPDLNQPSHSLINSSIDTKESIDKKIQVIAERPVFKFYLKAYLRERCIPLDLANEYICEVDFINKASKEPDKIYTALGFKNNAGGYELRSKNFKSCCAPKATSLICNLLSEEKTKPKPEQSVAVFEGFFSFLSFLLLQFHNKLDAPVPDNFLVLNSLSFLKSSFGLLDGHGEKIMLLDNDKSGLAATQLALSMGKDYKNYSHLYGEAKDLNALLVSINNPVQKQAKVMGMHR